MLLALYRVGTESLLTACKFALSQTSDPRLRFARCIDAHLRNARGLARLMFVLGGEAQRHESPLHARRMEVHAQLVGMLTATPGGEGVDPLTVRALVLALEGVVRFTLEANDEGRTLSDESLARARQVMLGLSEAALPRLPTQRQPLDDRD